MEPTVAREGVGDREGGRHTSRHHRSLDARHRSEPDRPPFRGYEIIFPGRIPPEARRCEGRRVIDAKSFIAELTLNIGDMRVGDEHEALAFATKIFDVAEVANAHKLALRFNY